MKWYLALLTVAILVLFWFNYIQYNKTEEQIEHITKIEKQIDSLKIEYIFIDSIKNITLQELINNQIKLDSLKNILNKQKLDSMTIDEALEFLKNL